MSQQLSGTEGALDTWPGIRKFRSVVVHAGVYAVVGCFEALMGLD
jgi:hypothetical protein